MVCRAAPVLIWGSLQKQARTGREKEAGALRRTRGYQQLPWMPGNFSAGECAVAPVKVLAVKEDALCYHCRNCSMNSIHAGLN